MKVLQKNQAKELNRGAISLMQEVNNDKHIHPGEAGTETSWKGAVVSKYQPLVHYKWGSDCEGWNLVDDDSLSVKQELMPVGTTEVKHFHHLAQQFFFVLKGRARFEVEDAIIKISAGEGLHIEAGRKHRVSNEGGEDLEFILCSEPSTKNDRINCE